MKIPQAVAEMAAPVAEKHGCFLWDTEFVTEAGERYLRVYIDNAEGSVSIDQCEAVSRELDALLDEADLIQQSYIFEVCSAGAERELKRPSDFERFIGSNVAVKLYSAKDGRKEHVGILTAYRDGDVELDGGRVFTKSETAQVRLRITF
ncbi:MAG: ribosome maturation factor RimP [Oscillospiraceae bacterium]|nr:ribosome maturation factor RimP [Oscillospiraceae bacterium]